MDDVGRFPSRCADERERFLETIQSSLAVRSHLDLLRWLQADVQAFLPHQILLAAWGNFSEGLIYVDVVSPLPGMRTAAVIDGDITPFLQRLFGRWRDHGSRPFRLEVPGGFSLGGGEVRTSDAFRSMRSAIAHGLLDQRGEHDCLYVAFSESLAIHPPATQFIQVLMPYIDAALRQVLHLPGQRKADVDEEFDDHGLSKRECEIMDWVRAGKTNQEIGIILDISVFTVKNHLQRIFRKLGVANRAQAVAKLPRARTTLTD